jgi:biopolymer transport protein ExbD
MDLVPLVTVMFQLLLFFILGSTFAVNSSINFEYATAPGPVSFEQKDISVTLAYDESGEGRIYVNDREVAGLEGLGQVLKEAAAHRPDLLLLIRPDARIESSRLIEVLGLAQQVGISRYRIAAQPAANVPAGTP